MPKPSDATGSLAARAEERFFTLDHVGVVRHLEGMDLEGLVPCLKEVLSGRSPKSEESIEEVRGLKVYTNVSENLKGGNLTLWVKATQVEGVGVVVDAKLFHSTDESAEADEELSDLMNELQARAPGGG